MTISAFVKLMVSVVIVYTVILIESVLNHSIKFVFTSLADVFNLRFYVHILIAFAQLIVFSHIVAYGQPLVKKNSDS
jgi:hypothetical protein